MTAALIWTRWPDVALVLALVLFVRWALAPRSASAPPRWQDPAWVLPLVWPMYLVHQFEEHGIDLRGQRYAFQADLCAVLGQPSLDSCPATPAFLFAVNAVGLQIAFALAWYYRRRNPLVSACVWGIPMINAVIHVLAALTNGSYNPGLFTALVLFLPLSAWMVRVVLVSKVVHPRQLLRVLATGLAAHGLLLVSLALRQWHWLSEAGLFLVNSLAGFLPLPFATLGARAACRRR